MCKRDVVQTRLGAGTKQALKRDPDLIINNKKALTIAADEELLDRMNKDPGSFSAGVRNAISGTATDKIAMKEQWARTGDEDPGKWLGVFMERLAAPGMVKLTVSPPPVQPSIDAVSVKQIPETSDAGKVDGEKQ